MSDLATTATSYTVRDSFQRAFNIYGPRIAVTAEEGQWTYAEIGEQARRLAAALHGLGLRQGERVAVLSGTRPEYVVTYAALAQLGTTVLTLKTLLNASTGGSLPESLELEAGIQAALLRSEPVRRSFAGFLAGRDG